MNHALLIPRRRSGFSPLNFGSDLALWLDPSYGVYTDRSTQLTAASSQYWSVASNATLQTGDIDFWVAGWFYIEDNATLQVVADKWGGSTDEWTLVIAGGSLLCYATVAASPASVAVSAGAWHFVLAWHDSVAGTINLKINNGTTDSQTNAGPTAGNSAFSVGCRAAGTLAPYQGRADSVMFGKIAGVAGVIAAINTYLYNSGSGRVYADLSAAQATAWGLVSAWDFDGDGLDAHGSNDLTAVNSPTYTSGIASGVAGDGDVVSLVDARTGPNCGPPSYAGRPLWVANAGKPYFSFDGTNDGLQTASDISLGAFTIAGNFYASGTAGMLYEQSANAGANDGTYLYGTTAATINTRRALNTDNQDLTVNWAVDSTWRTIVHVYDGNHAGHGLRFNGAAQSLANRTSADPGTAAATDKLNIACRNQASEFSAMRLGDLVAVNRVLTAGELSQLESWLASRRAA